MLQNSILEKELLLYKQKIQLKKQQQAQSGLSSQAQSSNGFLGTNSQFSILRNRENMMKIEDQMINDENDEKRTKITSLERRY